jgi:hypothetical protein
VGIIVPTCLSPSTAFTRRRAGTKVLPNAEAAGQLREEFDEVHMFGSGVLIRSLLARTPKDAAKTVGWSKTTAC